MTRHDELNAETVVGGILTNPVNCALLQILDGLAIAGCYLTAGCLFQTLWNLQSGQPADWGIKDYDVFYFDSDLSWAAENAVIEQVAEVCRGLTATVEVRNQARVHLWYETRFGVPCPPLHSATDGIDRYLVKATCLGINVRSGKLYSTHGLDELRQGLLRINPLNPQPTLFLHKAQSYQARWPWLKIERP